MIGSKYTFLHVDSYNEVPRIIDENIVYICNEDHIIVLRCLCGCGVERRLAMKGFYPEATGHWEVIGDTLRPSIQITDGCNSHLSLKNGIVQ